MNLQSLTVGANYFTTNKGGQYNASDRNEPAKVKNINVPSHGDSTKTSITRLRPGSLKPGGRLIYAVCTITRSETTAIAKAFTAAHPELTPSKSPLTFEGAEEDGHGLFIRPEVINGNGMYIAEWTKTKT